MNRVPKHLSVPIVALGMALALVVSAGAQDRHDAPPGGTSLNLRVSFGAPLHWTAISGTRVEGLPVTERPDYDMFRYGGTYYAYNNSRWYSSAHESGDFTPIDSRAVPSEFSSVPRENWHNYPSSWQDRHDQAPNGMSTTLQVNLAPMAHWARIDGTDVDQLPARERPNYDLFRSGGTYYAHTDNRWYMSRDESGAYQAMDDRDVPSEFSRIPRENWQNYPAGWRERHDERADRGHESMQVDVGSFPRWGTIRGTRVQQIRGRQRPTFDMFRFEGNFYVFDAGRWFTSARSRGRFESIDQRAVPSAVYRIPRSQWRNYPEGWNDRRRDPRTADNANRP